MGLTGLLGLALLVLALAALAGERRAAALASRRMRPWFVAADVIGSLFGLVVALVAVLR